MLLESCFSALRATRLSKGVESKDTVQSRRQMARARRATNQRRVWSERKAWGLTRKKREKFKVKRAGRTVAWQSRTLRLGMGRDATESGLRQRLTRTTAFVTKRTVHSTPQHSCTTPRTTRHAHTLVKLFSRVTLSHLTNCHGVHVVSCRTWSRCTIFQVVFSTLYFFTCDHDSIFALFMLDILSTRLALLRFDFF